MKPPTKLELKIVKGLADGVKANRLAYKLKLTQDKLAVLLSGLRVRFDCANSTHLVAYFLRNKLIE